MNPHAWDDRALVTAMALVPSFFSRNRMPAFYGDPRVVRARSRARLLRSIARDLRSPFDRVADLTMERMADAGSRLRYAMPKVFLHRSVDLTEFEMVVLRRLLAGNGPESLASTPGDGALVDEWLKGLLGAVKLP